MAVQHKDGVTPEKITDELNVPFDDSMLGTVKKGGASLTYVPVAEVIARLNFVLGAENWSDEGEAWISDDYPDWALAKVKITAVINGQYATHTGFGGESLKFYSKGDNAGKPLDLGDGLKGAYSDAFKKAAQKFGVGLDIARKEDALALEADERHRIALEGVPRASDEVIKSITELLGSFDDEQKATSKAWWKENRIPGLSSGDITEEQGAAILNKLQSLVKKAPAKRATKPAAPKPEVAEASA